MKLQQYIEFLKDKVQLGHSSGLDAVAMHPSLFPHQVDITTWALKRGKALIAAKFGLGKSRMQIELLRQVHQQTGRRVLVVCPLGVKHQFIHEDGPTMDTVFQYIGNDEDGLNATTPYLITNYERIRDGQISEGFLQSEIAGVTLDEGAILGNLGTKTQQEFSRILSAIPYRWVATATPAPNDYRQMIYFADFLDVMDAGQALTRFFGRNPDKAGDLILLDHMEKEFWLWVASWCIFVDVPSDLGYSDDGYVMPELQINFHRIAADHEAAQALTDPFGQHFLFADTAAGVQQAMKEKRNSLDARIAKVAEIVAADPADHYVIWHDLEDERKAITKAIPNAKAVYGSQDTDEAERLVLDFTHGRIQILAAKPQMFGAGANFQHHCHRAIYAGVGFKFRDFIQSLHRLQRYGQQHTVIVDIVHTDAEDHVVDVLMRKWQQHDEMVAKMREIIREYGLTNEALSTQMQRSLGVERQQKQGTWYTSINNDCVAETMMMADNSVDEIVTSIPFGNHYEYVASLNDFGHNQTDSDFWQQMDFLIPELLRVLKPGRMACIHVKDRFLYGHQTPHGMMEVDYFTHDCARAFKKHGFVSYGEIFIPTDVVRENNSTNRLGWSECCKDGSKMGVGLSEKVLLFRKPQTDKSRSYADEPVRKDKRDYSRGRWQIDAHSLWRSNGQHLTPADDPSLLTGMDGSQVYNWYKEWSLEAPYDYHQHVAFNEAMGDRLPAKFMLMPPQAPEEYEESVWTDVLFMRTLNMSQARRRVEKHVCPFPLDIVERLIVRYSNPDELIYDPFAGLHTVPYMAVKLGRRGLGCELNPLYWVNGIKYCEEAEAERSTPMLFELEHA
jgi:DNA modification methylase